MKKLFTMAALLTAALSMACFTGCAPKPKQIGLQLYSVNQDMGDVEASLQKVADAGYNVVETLGSPECFGLPAAEFKALCDSKGIKIVSTHTAIGMDPNDEEGVMNKWRAVFDGLKTMGAKYCVIPGFGLGSNLEELQGVCDYFNKVGKLAKEYGLLLGYHNHSHEYNVMDGQVIWEYMIEHTDPECVFFQMDVFWTTKGGKNPVEYLKKYPERIKMLHIKDEMVIGDSGEIDFEAIFKQFYANGYSDFVVEQEMPRGPEGESREDRLARMWDGVAKSAAYLDAASFVK
ncbi:sugar phosphate isomerase/epimerase [Alistipes sp. Z76]|nr:sugar phosphate isomerase/epimerase [Alistipes sp. Z76]NCE67127.1 sugar phosphate isomerase/epimerase [Muribaculaceae bacterium M3]